MMLRRVFLLGAVALVATACTGSRKRPSPPRERTVLVVDNRGYADMTLYVVVGTRRTRVGIAGGLKTTELTIPPYTLGSGGSLAFVADPIGGKRQSFSQEIYVREGERITLTIPP